MSAQDYKVEEVLELKTDLSARTSPRKDAKGNDCALLKVSVPSVKGIQFSEKVGDVKYHPGELEVYIPEGTVQIRYSLQDAGDESTIVFSDYGISIAGKSVYKIVLKPERAAAASTGSLSIKANKDGSVVLVDGKPVGQIPVTVPGLSVGEHTVSVPNTKGFSCPDQKVTIKSRELSHINLFLVEKEYMGLGLEVLDDYDGEGYIERYKTIRNNGKVGITDLNGKLLVPCEFDWVYPDSQCGGLFVVASGREADSRSKEGLYKPGYGIVAKCIYSSIATNHFDAPWLSASKESPDRQSTKFGYINKDGKEIVPFIFDDGTRWASESSSYMIVASYKSDRGLYTGIYDVKGKEIVAPRLVHEQSDFYEGVSVGSYRLNNGSYQYFIMDTAGQEVLLPEGYVLPVSHFDNGLTPAQNPQGKWGFINKKGQTAIPFRYDSVKEFGEGFAYVSLNGEWQFINIRGEKLGDKSLITRNVGKYLEISDGTYFGLMDKNGKICIPMHYESITGTSDSDYISDTDYIIATLDGESMVYNSDAKYLFTIPDYIEVDSRSREGVLMMLDWETRTYGFYNEKGEVIGDCIYSFDPPPFDPDKFTGNAPDPSYEYSQLTKFIISEGMVMLVLGDRFGFMDKTGKITVPAIYTAAFPFENGFTFVRKEDGEWIKIDKMNNRL